MITFLILAHRDYEHLKRLVRVLEGNRVIIHLDKKSKIQRSQIDNLITSSKVIVIEKNRSINVQWGGFSQVRAMLLLMQTALPLMAQKEKLMFLSGSDFPLVGSQVISAHLSQEIATEYLRYYPLSESKKDIHRWSLYHRWDFRIFKKRGSFLNRMNTLILKLLTKVELVLRGPKINPGFTLMAGSQWFAVSKECAENMLKIRSELFDKFFSTMFAPDEVYFATLFSLSDYARLNVDKGPHICDSKSSRLFQVRNLTYVDESLNKWLSLEDLNVLLNSSFIFARKFDSRVSDSLRSSLINHIESE
jgi:hypothetical protein